MFSGCMLVFTECLFTITRYPTKEGELFMKEDLCLNDSEIKIEVSREIGRKVENLL